MVRGRTGSKARLSRSLEVVGPGGAQRSDRLCHLIFSLRCGLRAAIARFLRVDIDCIRQESNSELEFQSSLGAEAFAITYSVARKTVMVNCGLRRRQLLRKWVAMDILGTGYCGNIKVGENVHNGIDFTTSYSLNLRRDGRQQVCRGNKHSPDKHKYVMLLVVLSLISYSVADCVELLIMGMAEPCRESSQGTAEDSLDEFCGISSQRVMALSAPSAGITWCSMSNGAGYRPNIEAVTHPPSKQFPRAVGPTNVNRLP